MIRRGKRKIYTLFSLTLALFLLHTSHTVLQSGSAFGWAYALGGLISGSNAWSGVRKRWDALRAGEESSRCMRAWRMMKLMRRDE